MFVFDILNLLIPQEIIPSHATVEEIMDDDPKVIHDSKLDKTAAILNELDDYYLSKWSKNPVYLFVAIIVAITLLVSTITVKLDSICAKSNISPYADPIFFRS